MDAGKFIEAVESYIARKDGAIPREDEEAYKAWKAEGLKLLDKALAMGGGLLPSVEPLDARHRLQKFLILLDKNDIGDCWRPHYPSPSALALWPDVESVLRLTAPKAKDNELGPPKQGTDAEFILKLLKKNVTPDAIVDRAHAAGHDRIGVKQVASIKHRYKHLLSAKK